MFITEARRWASQAHVGLWVPDRDREGGAGEEKCVCCRGGGGGAGEVGEEKRGALAPYCQTTLVGAVRRCRLLGIGEGNSVLGCYSSGRWITLTKSGRGVTSGLWSRHAAQLAPFLPSPSECLSLDGSFTVSACALHLLDCSKMLFSLNFST